MCFSFITLVSCSVYFERAGSLGVSLAGRVIFSFCVGFRCVECRSGTIYLDASLGWVAGLYRIFPSLGSVVVGTVQLKWWGGWPDFLVCLQFAVCSSGRRLSVVGLSFPYNNFIALFWYYLSVPYFMSC